MDINGSDTIPEYINEFISSNNEQLIRIYDEELNKNKIGCLGFNCKQSENKIDVFFMNEDMILRIIKKDDWIKFKETNQKIFLIHDIDINTYFLIYK